MVSAVGHEPDNPLCDLVADLRAATPTDAAKRVVPDTVAELALVGELRQRSAQALRNWVAREHRTLAQLRSRPVLADPLRTVTERGEEVERARAAVRRDITRLVAAESDRIGHLAARLATLGPAATLARGLRRGADHHRRRRRDPARRPATRPPGRGCASGFPTARWAPPVPARRMEPHERKSQETKPISSTGLRGVPRRTDRGGARPRAGRPRPRCVAETVGAGRGTGTTLRGALSRGAQAHRGRAGRRATSRTADSTAAVTCDIGKLERVSVILAAMGDATLTTPLGRVLVTGGAGFVGANLVTELLERGHRVRAFDRAPSPLPEHERLEVLQGDICDTDTVAAAVAGIDTIIHTAAIIDLMGGASVTEEYRKRSFDVNVGGTKNLVHAAQAAGVRRFVYTASNSVVMGGQRIADGDETLPYTTRFNDLYTETKVVAEKFVLEPERRRRTADLLDPAQRHLGPRRSDDVPQAVRERAGRPRQGSGRQQGRQARQLLRAQPGSRIHPRRRAPGAGRFGARAGVLHQRRRADQHVRVLPSHRRGLRRAVARRSGCPDGWSTGR